MPARCSHRGAKKVTRRTFNAPPDFKKFDGRRYVLADSIRSRHTKAQAERGARTARSKGWKARVVKHGGHHWVYVRGR